jgi:ATP-dependent Clp protease ATP-binding subunit ClpC
MPKINVYLPDELAEAVKEAGVPVSAVCQRALEQAVRRVTAIRETASSTSDLQDAVADLQHFTERTRTAIRLAHEQARTAGAAEIGTEHLLGGLLAEGGNLGLQVLRALEIDPDRVWSEIVRRTPGGGTVEDDPALRFGGPAANALELTVTEATSLGHNYVGCEHLLLGLISEPDGTAGQVLRSMGAEPRLARRAVSAALAGYVHLRGQAAAKPENALAAAVRQEIQPIVQRLERLEERLTDG